jgi:hypothetical protein
MSIKMAMETDSETLEEKVSRISAELTAQRMVVDAVIHLLSSDARILSGTKLLRVLDAMHDGLNAEFGPESDLAVALKDRRDGLRTMLIDSAIDDMERPAH